jgi:hypothetical protein
VENWAWEQVKQIIKDPKLVKAAVERWHQTGPDAQLSDELASARATLAKQEGGRAVLISRGVNAA